MRATGSTAATGKGRSGTPAPDQTDAPFIVAEVSKNWIAGSEVTPTGPLSFQFDCVINVNAARGYRLVTFQLHRLLTGSDTMNETIIAVFERRAEGSER